MSSTNLPGRSDASPFSFQKLLVQGLSAVGYLALAPMIALAITWIFALDVPAPVVVLQAAMGYILLGSLPVLAFAVMTKQRLLGCLAAFVAMCQVFFFAPQLQSATDLPAGADDAPKFTLLSHNIQYDNEEPLREVAAIQRVDAEIVFLQELTPHTYEALDEAGAFASYPYRAIDARYGALGLGIFSKFPLRDATAEESPGYPQQRAIATIHGRDIPLWNVHLRSPVNGPIQQWRGDLDTLRERLADEGPDVLVAGDFNANWGHARFRRLVDNGYREAAIDRGRGFARTWPVNGDLGARTKGFIRIDHVLTRGDVRPMAISEGSGSGSDHRAVVTHLALLP